MVSSTIIVFDKGLKLLSASRDTGILARAQKTLGKPIGFSGIGLHTGEQVSIRFCPASEGTGIVFRRVDLPGSPTIPATLEYVLETNRSTTIGVGNLKIHTIEHILSALRAYHIDNLFIEIDSIEPPVGDGSSAPFVQMIEEAGVIEQKSKAPIINIKQPVYWSEKEVHLVALPENCFRISYTLHYPNNPILQGQFYSSEITPEIFKSEIAPCRTFSQYDEIAKLMDLGLIKGGSLSNAVVIKDNAVLSSGGLHFSDEMVRHKVLDLIGDLSLVGFPFFAHIIAIRSGHAANCAFAKKIYDHITEKGQ